MTGNTRAACGLGAALFIAAFGVAGCGSGGSGSSSGTGTLSVQMVDAPADMQHVYVWVSRCEASGPAGWKTIFASSDANGTQIDLLDLQKSPMQLGSAQVEAGHYNQIRLIVTQAQLVKKDNSSVDVKIPSGTQTGIKLNVNADVPANTITGVLLDFNADASFHETPPGSGSWVLNPVIPAVLQVMSGTISGTVADSGGAAVAGAKVEAFKAGEAALPGAVPVNSSLTQAGGSFKVWALLAGSYDVKVTSADGTQTAVHPNVAVTAGQDTAVGVVALAP